MEYEIVLITIKTNIVDYYPAIIKAVKTYYSGVYTVSTNIVESVPAIITNIVDVISSTIITAIKLAIVLACLIGVYLFNNLIDD